MATLTVHPETPNSQTVHLDKTSMVIGSGPDADICLESSSVSDCHARIECKPDGYYLISLVNPPNVYINNAEITFQRLEEGDTVSIGDVTAAFSLVDDDAVTGEETVVGEMTGHAPQMPGTTALAVNPAYALICHQCGQHLNPGTHICPQCGSAVSNLPAMHTNYIPPTPPNQVGPGVLPMIALLAALTVAGAPIALVLGLMTLAVIRRQGGTVRDQKLAHWSIGMGLLWIMLGLVAVGGMFWRAHEREQLSTVEVRETQVIRALKNLACAQKFAHTIEFFDNDSDGNGKYGELAELAATKSPFFDSDLTDGEAYGYQFSMREASEGRFLAVAEPLRYNNTGKRTFLIDQTGQVRGGDTEGKRYGQFTSVLPILQGERSAYYRIDDEIAKDVMNYTHTLSSSPEDQEKKMRILLRVRKEYALTSVGRELEGLEESVDRSVSENRAQLLYYEAQQALKSGDQDVALAKLMEIDDQYSSFSKIAAVERELVELRSTIAQQKEVEAEALFSQAEAMERTGAPSLEVQQMYQRIEKLYPDTEIAARIATLKPELDRQMREQKAKLIFSDLMELSPEKDCEMILTQANQFRRNYSDTDLFAKVEGDLAGKERNARANSWRGRTEQSIAAGRMRGALAELESAIRENPDLQYDLRDLCIQLYRKAAEKMEEEGDARGALTYYTRLNRVLLASDSEEPVEPERMAKLHNEVGQADFEGRKYTEARWHLDNAAWYYPDDAQFNMRLGVARMYSGLYRSAETALTHALTADPDLDQARLYRAYLNMRTVLAYDFVIADKLALKDEEISEDVLFPAGEYPSLDSAVPDPSDLDLSLYFDAKVNRSLLSDLFELLQGVQEAAERFQGEFSDAGSREARNAAQLGNLLEISDFRNKLSALKTLHREDIIAQKTMQTMLKEMLKGLYAASTDLRKVAEKQPRIKPLSEKLLPQISTKGRHLTKVAEVFASNMAKEIELRELIFQMADRQLLALSSSKTAKLEISNRIQSKLNNPDSIVDVGEVLVILRDSMDATVDLNDLLGAAEGHASASSVGAGD